MKRYVTTLSVSNFNSIKVRLELMFNIYLPTTEVDFNSIKVRLERALSETVTVNTTNISIP